MAKTVLTYTWLAKKAMSLLKKDPAEFLKLCTVGSDKLARGATIRWYFGSGSCHAFSVLAGGREYCQIRGNYRDGKWYTYYHAGFTTTQYKKRLTDKFMPFTLPEGVRSYDNVNGHRTQCLFHNADGSVAETLKWSGGRRSRAGRMKYKGTDGEWYRREIVICDTDGKAVLDDTTSENLCLNHNHEEAATEMGFFPGAARTRSEWLKSISDMPNVDNERMMTLAAKSYLMASRLTEKYPAMRLAIFPAMPAPSQESVLNYRFGGDATPHTVIHRDYPSGEPTMYIMPAVVLYWVKRNGTGNEWSYLTVTIPPHGSEQLDPVGWSSYISGTARRHSDNRGYGRFDTPKFFERAYHSLPAFREDTKADDREGLYKHHIPILYGDDVPGRVDSIDKRLVNWADKSMVHRVHVKLTGGDDHGTPFDTDIPVAMRPDDIALKLEEKFLLDSLPLC